MLDQWGIEYKFPIVKTGILARITGNNPGKRIALRTDMDAFPITEQSGLEFQSHHPGVMHACGHDVHMTSILGTIRILIKLRTRFREKCFLYFSLVKRRFPGAQS